MGLGSDTALHWVAAPEIVGTRSAAAVIMIKDFMLNLL
jgi:hypothetical protein